MKAFDRELARGPWRLVPVPTFLAEGGAGLRFQLWWAVALIVVFALAGAATWNAGDGFLGNASTYHNVWRFSIHSMLFALGQAAVVARGGFDFSFGPTAVLAGAVAVQTGNPLLGVAAAVGCGVVHGVLVGAARVPGWILTFFTAMAVRGAADAALGDGPVLVGEGGLPGWIPPASSALVVLAAVALAACCQVRLPTRAKARWRERVGDGLPYVFSAGLAGAGGIYMAWRTSGVSIGYFQNAWPEVLAVAILGGTWLGSGRPNVVGTVVAVLCVGVLRYGLVYANVAPIALVGLGFALLPIGVLASLAAHTARALRASPPSVERAHTDVQ